MPGPYNTHTIANVFRSVVQFVEQYPELLNTPGIFRVPGSKEETERLLEQLIDTQFNVETLTHYVMNENEVNKEHLNNVLGMIATVFKNSKILISKDSLLDSFSKKLKSVLDSQQEEELKNSATAQLFDKFINDLLLSKIVAHQRAGEILYHYCHLMHTVGTFQESNRMTYNNLAIIMAPSFTDKLGLYPNADLLGFSTYVSQLTSVLENYIADAKWNYDFKECHADKLEHLAKTRHSLLNQLENMKEASRKAVTVPMKSLMLQASMKKAQIDEIEKGLKDRSLKKEEKKALAKELKSLEKELNEIQLEISELNPKIVAMNQGQQKIQKEIELLSLSENQIAVNRENRSSNSNLAQFSIFESGSSTTTTLLSSFPEERKDAFEDKEESEQQEQQLFI